MKKIIIPILVVLASTGCSLLFSKVYDIKTLKNFDESKINAFNASITHENILFHTIIGDSDSYNCIRKKSKSELMNNGLSQPIQILYFDSTGRLISFHANCYAKGNLSGLDWNYDGRFEQFVPKSAIKLDSVYFSLNLIKDCLKTEINGNFKNSKLKYTVVIFWTLMFETLSKKAIDLAIKNISQFGKQEEVAIYLINNDKAFLETK
jgi:hypothetical protein